MCPQDRLEAQVKDKAEKLEQVTRSVEEQKKALRDAVGNATSLIQNARVRTGKLMVSTWGQGGGGQQAGA